MNTFQSDLWHNLRRLSFRRFRPEKFSSLQKIRPAFDEHRCIFVHIPKCAGISVCQSLFGNNVNLTAGHHNLKRYQIVFAPREFRDYFKFAFVRNPYDRLVSAFFFLKKGGLNQTDKAWGDRNLSAYDSFDVFVKAWVNPRNIRSALHFHPQCDYICLEKNRPAVDFIGYYENLEADFQLVCRKLKTDSPLLSMNRNPARGMDYQAYYTDETKAIVADVYADDLRVLGYAFDNSSLPNQLALRDGKSA